MIRCDRGDGKIVTTTLTNPLVDTVETRVQINPEDLRNLLRQAEAELHHSEVYRQTLNQLQQNLGEAAESCQTLIKTLGREAMRLVLRQLVRQHRPSVAHNQAVQPSPEGDRPVPPPPPSVIAARASEREMSPEQNPGMQTDPSPHAIEPLSSKLDPTAAVLNPAAAIARRLFKKHEQPNNALSPEEMREAKLREIGQTLQQARQTKAWSIPQVHYRTRIPIHQLNALEAGKTELLPEDIYLRGFIRRVGDMLGLNGAELAASLPIPDVAKTIIPSWQQQMPTPPSLQPIHLYLGYATLMAGAVGGLAWMSNSSVPNHSLEPNLPDIPEQTNPTNSARTGVANSVNTSATTLNVAPPEAISME